MSYILATGLLSLESQLQLVGRDSLLDHMDDVRKGQRYQNVSDEELLNPPKEEHRQGAEGSGSDSDYENMSTVGTSYRVPCSNNCGEFLDSDRLESHIAEDCPLTVIDCDFKGVGCTVRLPRRDLPTHLGQAVVIHQSKQLVKYEERLKMLESDNERLAIKCKRLETEHQELERKVNDMFDIFKRLANMKEIPKDPEPDNDDLEYVNVESDDIVKKPNAVTNSSKESKPGTGYMNAAVISEHQDDGVDYSYVFASKSEPCSPLPTTNLANSTNFEQHKMNNASKSESCSPLPITNPSSLANMIMTNFEQHKMNNDHWVSQPFFTHTQGYKMCLRVTANGQGSGKDTHITVGIYLMKGEFDEKLVWPFRGDITIQLLNQQGSSEHYTRTVYKAKGDRGEARTTDQEKFISAWGISQFKPHSELHPKYLKNDSLRFQVSTVVNQPEPSAQLIETEV